MANEVQDPVMGFCVGSGDQVAAIVAKELHATDLVLATDVAGVYDAEPKAVPNAHLIKELSLGDLNMIAAGTTKGDASGAMRGKLTALSALRPELEGGMRMAIISMMGPGRLKGLLSGDAVEGTRIRP